MPKESKSSLKPKKGESFLDAASQIAAKTKMEEVYEGIQTFLRVAYLKRKGILKEDFWPFELDTPTTVVSILADYLVLYYEMLNEIDPSKTVAKVSEVLSGINAEKIKTEANVFYNLGRYWLVKYNGKEIAFENLQKIKYIVYLLDAGKKGLHVTELVDAVTSRTHPYNKLYSDMPTVCQQEEESIYTQNGPIRMQYDGNDLEIVKSVEKKAFDKAKEIRKEIDFLNEELEKAKSDCDLPLIESIERDIDNNYEILRAFSNKELVPKIKKDDVKVRNQIARALEDIGKYIPSLKDHLKRYIDIRSFRASYNPPPSKKNSWFIYWGS